MRPGPIAVLSLVSAVLGAAAALTFGWAAGWLGGGERRTVVVTDAAPAVGIKTSGRAAAPLLGNGFRPAEIYARRSPGVVTIYALLGSRPVQASQGSGFVVSPEGYILTNAHVITSAGEVGGDIEAASEVYVEFADRDRIPARIIGWDVFDDVGLIKVDPKAHSLAPVPLGDSSRVRVGEPVAAIGSPFGNENSLAVGVVSAVHRSIDSLTSEYNLIDAIQIDAPINHGNSGGPLFDARGRVVGINAQIRSNSGRAEGVGFAVPINSARRSMNELIAVGRVAYAYVGITTEDVTPTLARRLGYSTPRGALVVTVRPGSAGARAGLRGGEDEVDFNGETVTTGGDVIVGIGRQKVEHAEDLVRIVTESLRPGQTVSFSVVRGKQRLRVPVLLKERPVSGTSGR
ncbi:MAG: S1C family serine protease [Gaiellaceae bacterium]